MEQLGNITLHRGDCLEVLRTLPKSEQPSYPLLGIELDQHYYDAAGKRIIDYQNEPNLFKQ